MSDLLKLNLRLFGEGGEGGDSAEGNEGDSGEDSVLASLPDKAKGAYKKAVEKNRPNPVQSTDEVGKEGKPSKPSYADMIKSDDYKEEHKAYMEKTISDRLKKYKGIEESNAKMSEALSIVANKYGLDASAEDFVDSLSAKIKEDDSYYESYAMEHDMSVEDAKRNIELEHKVKVLENQEAQRQKRAQINAEWQNVLNNAEKTKAMYPQFDLEVSMQNPDFARICRVTNGDTTAAYMATNWKNVIPSQVHMAAQKAEQQIANSVKANKQRPIENGLSSQAAAISTPSFKGMSRAELKAYAENQLRQRGR